MWWADDVRDCKTDYIRASKANSCRLVVYVLWELDRGVLLEGVELTQPVCLFTILCWLELGVTKQQLIYMSGLVVMNVSF